MANTSLTSRTSNARAGIAFILVAMVCVTINDTVFKSLSDRYPLHQLTLARSVIGIAITIVLLQFEGGWRALRTDRPGLHAFRALLIVVANITFFAGLAVMPLGTATALFFVAPLIITLLSIPFLGEKVGVHRMGAVVVGFLGVAVMLFRGDLGLGWSAVLPVFAAVCYAGMQILTRKLGVRSPASAMAIYIQGTFIMVGLGFWIVAGDGRFAEGATHDSVIFLLRAWSWPAPEDYWAFGLLGLCAGIVGYTISQAYRLGDAATIAPYEYSALPLALFMGWAFFGEWPDLRDAVGIALIGGAGVYVFLRERRRGMAPSRGPVRR
ncbi:MAG: DMT family transporter [Pseudomonadota bacterium]